MIPNYLTRTIAKTVGSGKFDPLSLAILAAAGSVAIIEHVSKQKQTKKEN